MIVVLLLLIAFGFTFGVVVALTFRKEQYEYKVSTYLALFFVGVAFSITLSATLGTLGVGFQPGTKHAGLLSGEIMTYLLLLISMISLSATDSTRRERRTLLLMFLLPILVLSVLKLALLRSGNIPAPTGSTVDNLWGLSQLNFAWAGACFYRFCVWRIRKLKKIQLDSQN
jgi:hypothetical protein